MTTQNLLDVPNPWPKRHRPWNAQLIPNYLADLARRGVYYDSHVRSIKEVDPGAAPFARGVLPAPLEDGVSLNPTWEEQTTDGEEDLEPSSIQSIIRHSLRRLIV